MEGIVEILIELKELEVTWQMYDVLNKKLDQDKIQMKGVERRRSYPYLHKMAGVVHSKSLGIIRASK